MAPVTVTFIGGGNMATSLIGGLIKKGYTPEQITVSDPLEASRRKLRDSYRIRVMGDNNQAVREADLVILAVKPQVLKSVARELAPSLPPNCVVVSIAAGIPMRALQAWLGEATAIVRCMPNTPALVRAGAAGLYASPQTSAEQKRLAEDILATVGIIVWVDQEAQIDAVTALSGSGPAYFFLVMEAMQQAGEQLGLQPEIARRLTLQTALGAAKMAAESEIDVAELRRRVTSPGGTTERAIQCFADAGLPAIFNQAMTAAAARAAEMAEELSD